MRREHLRAIDEQMRHCIELQPGALPVSWLMLVATRDPEGGGEVMRLMSDSTMPPWEVKGILTEALDDVRVDTVRDDDE